jgi:prepilin-type N-terminal cleavage/methylation domain-containing protein
VNAELVATRAERARLGFTLMEVLVSIGVLTLLVVIASQFINSASMLTASGNKHIDADAQARAVFDRMAIDFAQMLRRPDIDYYLKQADTSRYPGHSGGHGHGSGTKGQDQSDQMAFFSQVPGYYPSPANQSSISLIAYRVNADPTQPAFNKLQRMAKGLLWNGVSNSYNVNSSTTIYPIVFLPQTIAAMGRPWYAAINNDTNSKSQDADYETLGPQVFRFEYYYLLKNGQLTETPWDTAARPTQTSLAGIGLADVEAIAVTIAVVDPKSRTLLSDQNLVDLAAEMNDFKTQTGNGPVKSGVIETQWNSVITSNATSGTLPRAAVSAIRVYSRYFNLNLL